MNLTIFGVYLTCYHDQSSKAYYSEQLRTLTSLIEMYIDESEIMIIGDFQSFPSVIYDNLPRSKVTRNPLSSIFQKCLVDNKLKLVDVTDGIGPTHTYEHKSLKHQSYIDHIAVITENNLSITECQVHSKCDTNISDHQEVEITIKPDKLLSFTSILEEEMPHSIPRYCWKNPAFVNNYQRELNYRIFNIDPNMDSTTKINELNKIIVESAIHSFYETYPSSSVSNDQNLGGLLSLQMQKELYRDVSIRGEIMVL